MEIRTDAALAGPTEQAPMLRPWGLLAPLVVQLLRAEPALGARLAFAPPRALHAIAAWLHYAQRACLPEAVLRDRLGMAPRSLLQEALPEAPPRLFHLLDRCQTPVWQLGGYAGLARLVQQGYEDLLPRTGPIRHGQVLHALGVLDMEQPLRNTARAAGSPDGRDHLASVVAWLRAARMLTRIEALPRSAGPAALARADGGRLEAHPLDFPLPEGWRRILGAEELWQVGRRMRLCVAPGEFGSGDLMISMLMNRSGILLHEDPPALAQIREMPAGLWCLDQIRGPGNSAVPALSSSLLEALQAAGVTLVPRSLQDALDHLLAENERGHLRPGNRRVRQLLEAADEGAPDRQLR